MAKKPLWLSSQEDVRLAIRRRGAEIAQNMSDKELFMSGEFKDYITKLLDFILRNHKLYRLVLQYDDSPDSLTACTDGKSIYINAGNDLVRHSVLLERRFKVCMGMGFHEAAHKLFMDFTTHKKAMKALEEGKLYGNFETFGNPSWEKAYEEIKEVVATPYCKALASLYAELSNFLADGHDEAAMMKAFPGFISDCIQTMDDVQFETTPTIEEMVAERRKDYEILMAMLLEYSVFGRYKTDNAPETEKYRVAMSAMESTVSVAMEQHTLRSRWDSLNLLMLQLWEYIRDLFPKNPPQQQQQKQSSQQSSSNQQSSNGQGQNGGQQGQQSQSGGNQPSSQQSSGQQGQNGNPQGQQQSGNGQSAPQASATQQPNNGQQGQQPQSGGNQPSSQQSNGQQGQNGGQQGQQQPNNGQQGQQPQSVDSQPTPEQLSQQIREAMQSIRESMGSTPAPQNGSGNGITPDQIAQGQLDPGKGMAMGNIAQNLGEEKAAAQIQSELTQAQMDAIRNCNMPLIHQGVTIRVNNNCVPNEKAYNETFSEVKATGRKLVGEMQKLREMYQNEEIETNLPFGPIIQATQAYRPDASFFAKKNQPGEMPDMAIVICMDESGSMRGRKLELSKKTAILVEYFAHELNIPNMIVGHNASNGTVRLNIYSSFTSTVTKKERYSLASMDTSGCNRDGCVIRLCADLLAKRPERIKLMIVISDGAPNDSGYRGYEAQEDIRKVVAEYRRKGMLIYGAAIDDDKEIIEKLYGQGFLSIQNLNNLPRTLIRLIQRHMT